MWAPLIDACDAGAFGGKAATLARALRAGLPAPLGLALTHRFVNSIGTGDVESARELAALPLPDARTFAVRSSSVGEDSTSASFAGQHNSELGVLPGDRLCEAVQAVWRSGFSDAARGYRARLGLAQAPMAVIIQPLVDAEVAGVVFTRHPISGAPELMIEASWGLGVSVVQGRVIPDRYRLSPEGTLLARTVGDKRIETRSLPGGGVADRPVPAGRARTPCLDETRLAALHQLASDCDAVWDGDHDLEWAFARVGTPYLLQRRPVTTAAPRGGG